MKVVIGAGKTAYEGWLCTQESELDLLNPADFEITDIYKTSVCPLAKVMRRELKKRNVKHLKVVYSKEEPIAPIGNAETEQTGADVASKRRSTPGSVAFVPSVVGLLIASEVVKDLIKE